MKALKLPMAAAFAAAVLVAFSGIAPAGASSDDAEVIEVEDDCDPETFDAAVGPGTCVGDGDTTFDELVEELEDDGEHGKWRNHPDDTHIDHGESLHVVNEGGEFHTFTMVDVFGGGCVPFLNDILGLPPAPDELCAAIGPADALPAGFALDVEDLAPGHYMFMCLIHPWMQTTVEVRDD